MAPAEVEIFQLSKGTDYKKVHAGDAQEFETKEIKLDVICHGLELTEIEFSGQDLDFRVKKDNNPIQPREVLIKVGQELI